MTKMRYMLSEMLEVSLVLMVLMACGKKLTDVKIAAMFPKINEVSIGYFV